MSPVRKRRLAWVFLLLLMVSVATLLVLQAFRENMSFYYDPSAVVAGKAPSERTFRMGGLVAQGSLQRSGSGLMVQFTLTDMAESVSVVYEGILPDLFREGQGVIVNGSMRNGLFVAEEVLAKHDENYMPPEVAASLKGQP